MQAEIADEGLQARFFGAGSEDLQVPVGELLVQGFEEADEEVELFVGVEAADGDEAFFGAVSFWDVLFDFRSRVGDDLDRALELGATVVGDLLSLDDKEGGAGIKAFAEEGPEPPNVVMPRVGALGDDDACGEIASGLEGEDVAFVGEADDGVRVQVLQDLVEGADAVAMIGEALKPGVGITLQVEADTFHGGGEGVGIGFGAGEGDEGDMVPVRGPMSGEFGEDAFCSAVGESVDHECEALRHESIE